MTSGTDVVYLYDGWQCIQEDEWNSTTSAWEPRRRYIYGGQYIDEPVIFEKYSDATSSWDRYYYCQNANFNVMALTDSSGNVVERVQYDPYGKATVTVEQGQTATGNPYLFQGRRWDAAAGLYNFRNRFYSPELGRFVQRDPAGYVDGMSLYEFVGGRPVVAVDPEGLIGGECHYTGKERMITETQTVRLSTNMLDFFSDPTYVKNIFHTCQCQIKCCDYDLQITSTELYMETFFGPVPLGEVPSGVAWVRDPKDDYYKWQAIGNWLQYASYQDMKRDLTFAAEGAGALAYNKVANWSRTKSQQQMAEQLGATGLEDWLGGEIGKTVLFDLWKEKGILSSEDVWNARYKAINTYNTKLCQAKCKAKKGQPE